MGTDVIKISESFGDTLKIGTDEAIDNLSNPA